MYNLFNPPPPLMCDHVIIWLTPPPPLVIKCDHLAYSPPPALVISRYLNSPLLVSAVNSYELSPTFTLSIIDI